MSTSTTPDSAATGTATAPKKAAPRKAAPRKAVAKKARAAAGKRPAPQKAASRKVAAPAKPAKVKKPKLVRDSFTIPKAEYQVLDALKQRSAGLARPVKKSELLRAGIKALARMSDAALLDALQAVPAIKTGRPKAGSDSAKAV